MEKPKKHTELSLMPALITCKCPRCRVGKVYKNGPYSLTNRKISIKCEHCGLTYDKEPGYFYAAMYVGYAFIVAELVTAAVGTYILTGSDNPRLYLGIMLPFVLVLSPFNYRYSRMLLLYFLTPGLRYHPEMS
ncbi:MAG TPA: DUF983 domain-containing protein [Mucilaginibacter sp.]|jgi:uncharacterized protein (DUF983 family)|nr:DUF983 domain-containing protein [Mucilaginibacter sp.]